MQSQPYSQGNGLFNPQIKSIADAVREAGALVDENRSDSRPVLPTRWARANKLLMGGWRFHNNYLLAGASGHGKSFMINMTHQDMITSLVDGTAPKPFRILHFGFEQSAADEMLRRASSELEMSYGKLLSADGRLRDHDYTRLRTALKAVKNLPLDFIEEPMSNSEIYQTVKGYKRKYPDDALVITLDHTLLTKEDFGEDEIKMLANMGKMFITIRKEFGTCSILLGQLNDKIEGEKRRDPGAPSLHYPTKTDCHGSKQLYHAMDTVMVLHRPELLHLEYYGRQNIPTENLVAWHFLKNRKGEQGLTLLKNDLANGRFLDWDYNQVAQNSYGFAQS